MMGPHLFVPGDDGKDPRVCPNCGDGQLSLKLGRFGAFVGCTNYPECRYTRQLGQKEGEAVGGTRELGVDPNTGEPVTLRSGRFGPYFQRGEAKEKGDKPHRSSVPKGTDLANVDLELALKMLSLPREVGKHPEDGEPIVANFGRFGPYVSHNKQYASLDSDEEVFAVGINRAVTLLAEKKAKGFKRRGPEALKELGANAEGTMIKLMKGRYGPYVSDGSTNATVPNGTDAMSVTLEQALSLIADREAKGGGKKKKKKAAPKAKSAPKAKAPAKAKPKKAKAKPKAEMEEVEN
jgi:DNA topoisomerase-1